ncbi:MAG: alpha-ketoacid dehydrogenase subunit beta, partial [Anaerolineales bacterium]
ILGRSIGMALAGLLPLPEIQFRKYADPAYEQIVDLGTLRWRTANNFAAPVVVRIPVGYGKKTGDPWHSVSGEAIYAHTLGWRIAYPSNASDAVGLLRTSMRGDDPTFFLEHRALLDTAEGRRPYPGDDFCLPFAEANVLTEGDEVSIVTWGETVHRCLSAASSFHGRVTLLDLRTIIPWDKDRVLESVHQTGKVLIVHEDTLTAGFAGEIIATITAEAFNDLDAPIMRLATADVPIPYNINLMQAVIPSVEAIKTKIAELLAF